MSKQINSAKIFFISLQIIILFLCVSFSILIVSFDILNKHTADRLNTIDQTAFFVAEQIKIKKKILSSEIRENFNTFVLDLNEGFLIYDRKDKSYEDKLLWESHRTKLIYEMQKQKNGWIFYPEIKSSGFFKPVKAIRYLTIEEFGWILAVESQMESQWSIFINIFSPNVNLSLFIIFLIGCLLLFFVSNRNFSVLKKLIADMLESGLMNINHETILKAPKINTFEHPVLKPAAVMSTPIIQKPEDVIKNKEILKNNKTDNFEMTKKSPDNKQKNSDKINEVSNKTDDKELADDLKIEIQGIKSPLLKKMINELRKK